MQQLGPAVRDADRVGFRSTHEEVAEGDRGPRHVDIGDPRDRKVDGDQGFGGGRIVAVDPHRASVGASGKVGGVDRHVERRAPGRTDPSRERRDVEPIRSPRDPHREARPDERRVERDRQPVVPSRVLDPDRRATGESRDGQVLEHDRAAWIENRLEGIGTASRGPGHVLVLDDQPGAVVVGIGSLDSSEIEILPEGGNEVFGRSRIGERLVRELRRGIGEADPAVGARPELRELPPIEREGEADRNGAEILVEEAHRKQGADGADLRPIEHRPAGLIAVGPAIAEEVGPARSVHHRRADARIRRSAGDRHVVVRDHGRVGPILRDGEIERPLAGIRQSDRQVHVGAGQKRLRDRRGGYLDRGRSQSRARGHVRNG